MKSKRIFFFVIMTLIGFSCSQEKVPTPYTYTKVFTGENSKTWKLKFLEETLNGKVTQTFIVACAADDQYVFHANSEHLYEANTGSTKCYSTPEADLITNTWTFNNASATLTMLLPFFSTDSSYPFIVREAKTNTMVLEIFFDNTNTASYRIHFEVVSEN